MLNKLGLAPGTKLTFYNSVAKALQLKVRKFLELNLTFVEVTGEELVRGWGGGVGVLGAFWPPILDRVKKLSLGRGGNPFFKKSISK